MAENGIIAALAALANRILKTVHLLLDIGYTEGVEHFVYELRITTGAADAIGTTYQGAIRISQEAAFCVEAIQCNTRRISDGIAIAISNANNGAAGDFPDFPYRMQITDGGADRILHNEQIDGALIYGTYGGLRPPIKRRLFRPNSNIAIDLTSLKLPNTAWAITVAFVGFKLYGVVDPRQVSLPLALG